MRILSPIAVAGAILLLSLIASFNQVKAQGLSWQEVHYRVELEAAVERGATEPRILIPYVAVATFHALDALGIERAFGIALVLLSVTLTALLLGLALYYYRRLGVPVYLGIFGLSAIAWGMTQGNANATLAFDRSVEAMTFLCFALVMLGQRDFLLFPLMLVATFNRESALIIPLLYLVARVNMFIEPCGIGKPVRCVAWSIFLFLIPFLAYSTAFSTGAAPAKPLALGDLLTVILIMGPLPLLALLSYRAWPLTARRFTILLALFWCAVLWWGYQGDSNLLLVPMVMILVPGTLLTIVQTRRDAEPRRWATHAV